MTGNKQVHLFTAPWCPTCHNMIEPLKGIEKEYPDYAFVYHDLSDKDEAAFAGELRVAGLPTVIVIKDGAETARIVGYDRWTTDRVREALA